MYTEIVQIMSCWELSKQTSRVKMNVIS